MRPSRSAFALALLALTACETQLDVNPAPPIPDFPNTVTKIQSETSLSRAQTSGGAQRLIVAYNDFSSLNGAVEFLEDANGAVTGFAFGASQLGFSTSDNEGTTWTRRGKVRAPSAFPVILSDPSVASDPGNPSIVYMSALATSLVAWNAIPAPDQFAPRLALPDSFCVARSTDGGDTFPVVRCTQVTTSSTAPDLGTRLFADLPTLTVDGLGCPWVAIEDRTESLPGDRTVAVFRASPMEGTCRDDLVLERMNLISFFNPLLTDPEISENVAGKDGESRPVLRTQANGDIWLGTELRLTSTERIGLVRRFAIDTSAGNIPGWNFATGVYAGCSEMELWRAPELRPTIDPGEGTATQIVRAAYRMDFDVGTTADGFPDLRIVTLQPRPSTTDGWAVYGTQLVNNTCVAPSGWNTQGLSGKQVQPRLRFTRQDFRTATVPNEWTIAYLSTAGRELNISPVIDIEARQMTATAFGLATDLAPSNYPVCAAKNGYWGDYFDFVPFVGSTGTTKRVVAVTDSRGSACQRGEETAMPQHI